MEQNPIEDPWMKYEIFKSLLVVRLAMVTTGESKLANKNELNLEFRLITNKFDYYAGEVNNVGGDCWAKKCQSNQCFHVKWVGILKIEESPNRGRQIQNGITKIRHLAGCAKPFASLGDSRQFYSPFFLKRQRRRRGIGTTINRRRHKQSNNMEQWGVLSPKEFT